MEYRREYPRCQESCQLALEFGYAIGASRPLALKASAQRCSFCPENFIAGIELYGGLGDRHSFGLHDTSQYLARVIAWNLPSDWTPRLSPGLGLNDNSYRFLLRLPRILRVRLSHAIYSEDGNDAAYLCNPFASNPGCCHCTDELRSR